MKDKTICYKIIEIRKAAGGDVNTCPMCMHPINYPYVRQNNKGEYLEGCIDASHSTVAMYPTGYREWFGRVEALRFRANYLDWLKSH